MALLTTNQILKAGTTPAYVAVAASDTITADTDLFLHVKNAGGSPDTVTLVDAGITPAGSAATSPTVSVPATTGDRMIAIPQQLVNPATGLITITHSFTTSVTCSVFRLG